MKLGISIIGPRGCGKGSSGRKLADMLDYKYVDQDDVTTTLLKKRHNAKSLSELVKKYGPDKAFPLFRSAEADAMDMIFDKLTDHRFVVATGGGAVAHNQDEEYRIRNVATLGYYTQCFYVIPFRQIDLNFPILARRVTDDPKSKDLRPGLVATTTEDPYQKNLQEATTILPIRDPIYRRVADITQLTGKHNAQWIAERMFERHLQIQYHNI